MLYKFKSKVAGDLIMLEANGRRVLDIIGKDGGPQGIILPEQMGPAIAALEAAIAKEEAAKKHPPPPDPNAAAEGHAPTDSISLRQRAMPFIDMLRVCQAEGREVVWGV
ncbi:DUF1840 domain-containing protein [Variovorax terrae]|uniref:DUF1840 domain-containing protein n=1 Tax=Variovorax terrae TaxID=2923278 RepID=A0A9X1VVT7_9BURK|nr:DUF1840 domain-containing protein [Variovorax terrae]MCJ0764731.1 DUF1840 domain-containing protein [Variovorax terrae]